MLSRLILIMPLVLAIPSNRVKRQNTLDPETVKLLDATQIAGVDYPNYRQAPITSFNCAEKPINVVVNRQGVAEERPSYFADVESGCQAFHVCHQGKQFDFVCPEKTLFNQRTSVCDSYWEVPCEQNVVVETVLREQVTAPRPIIVTENEEIILDSAAVSECLDCQKVVLMPQTELLTTDLPITSSGDLTVVQIPSNDLNLIQDQIVTTLPQTTEQVLIEPKLRFINVGPFQERELVVTNPTESVITEQLLHYPNVRTDRVVLQKPIIKNVVRQVREHALLKEEAPREIVMFVPPKRESEERRQNINVRVEKPEIQVPIEVEIEDEGVEPSVRQGVPGVLPGGIAPALGGLPLGGGIGLGGLLSPFGLGIGFMNRLQTGIYANLANIFNNVGFFGFPGFLG